MRLHGDNGDTGRSVLADIAWVTNLRAEDAVFALNECGLLGQRRACERWWLPTRTMGTISEEAPKSVEDGDSLGDVLEAVVRGVVEDLAEPGVCIESEHGHVWVRVRERGDVQGERSVVVDDVLRVEGIGGVELPGATFHGQDVEEEVWAAEAALVCFGLCEHGEDWGCG